MSKTQEKISEEFKVDIKILMMQGSLHFIMRKGMDNITNYIKDFIIQSFV